METYDHLKTTLLLCLSSDTDEDRMATRERLSVRKFREGGESIDELACDIERLLDRASPGFPANLRDTELRYHLINALPQKVAVKLWPKKSLAETILRTRELCFIYS